MSYWIANLFLPATFLAATAVTATASPVDPVAPAVQDGYSDDLADELNALRIAGQSDAVIERLINDPAVTTRKEHRPLAILALAQINSGLSSDADTLLSGISRPYIGKCWEMMLAMGTLFIDTNQPHRAVPALKRALVYSPNNAEVELTLLRSRVLQNRTDASVEALRAFDRVDELPPGALDLAIGNTLYAHATWRMDKGLLDEASLDLLREARQRLPEDAAVAVTIASVLTELRLTEEADKAIQFVQDNFEARMEEALYLRAVLADHAGDGEEAFRLATDAIHLSARTHEQALALAGRVGQDIGRFYEARKHLDRLLAISPKNFQGRFQSARYNIQRAKDKDVSAGDVGPYLREAEKHCLFAKVSAPHHVGNLELLEEIYLALQERGNKNVDLPGVQRDLLVARKLAARNSKGS